MIFDLQAAYWCIVPTQSTDLRAREQIPDDGMRFLLPSADEGAVWLGEVERGYRSRVALKRLEYGSMEAWRIRTE